MVHSRVALPALTYPFSSFVSFQESDDFYVAKGLSIKILYWHQ